jgi:DNA-binding helix-hairpin-helix protein with protein kinase domain
VSGLRYTEQGSVSTFDTAGLSRYYAGIVAEMPLYSAEELNRQRTQEYQRRGEIANNVAKLLKALADRQRSLRMIGINESVEARSQYRVQEGLAPAEEQIANLKAVADKVGDLDEANASLVAARLALVGQCRDDIADTVNRYLIEITR